jgi:Zn-dependent protease
LNIDISQIFISFTVLLFSLTIHELSHAWTADRLGDPTARLLGRISLNPLVHADPIGTILFPLVAMFTGFKFLIGWAKPVPVNVNRLRRPRRDYVLVAAAGPASNIAIAIVAGMLLKIVPVSPYWLGQPNLTVPIAELIGRAIETNVMLAIFNMIPIPPLDGGNVLGGLLPRQLAYRYDSLVRPYGFILLYALMFTDGFDRLVSPPSRLLISWLV